MKIDKDTAKSIWIGLGRTFVGAALCMVGGYLTIKGSEVRGIQAMATEIYDTDPDLYEDVKTKLNAKN